jgi:hypothetical protein
VQYPCRAKGSPYAAGNKSHSQFQSHFSIVLAVPLPESLGLSPLGYPSGCGDLKHAFRSLNSVPGSNVVDGLAFFSCNRPPVMH